MKIAGLSKLTLLDFPGRMACIVFTEGCNFRCPFCHNASLVTHTEQNTEISEQEFFSFLQKRKGILDGVVITGGEPTIAKGLYEFIAKVREFGYPVKLDTNGSFPDRIKQLLDDGMLDYIAMDIKTTRERYPLVTGVAVDYDKIAQSINIIKNSGIPHEFRTTVVRGLHEMEDIVEVARMLGKEESYYLQGFVDSGDILGEGCMAFSDEEMRMVQRAAAEYCPKCQLRGIE